MGLLFVNHRGSRCWLVLCLYCLGGLCSIRSSRLPKGESFSRLLEHTYKRPPLSLPVAPQCCPCFALSFSFRVQWESWEWERAGASVLGKSALQALVPAVIYNRKYEFLLYVKRFSDAKKLVLEDNLWITFHKSVLFCLQIILENIYIFIKYETGAGNTGGELWVIWGSLVLSPNIYSFGKMPSKFGRF